MAERIRCFVTKANEDSPAFAIGADDDEGIFIPHATAEAAQLEVGDELIAIVKANDQPERSKWFAVAIRAVEN